MPNKLSQFWQELKRRKVVRVITVYAAAAFVILELIDIVAPSLGLPDWTLNFIIILLWVGFIITVIVSWVYDVTPQGGIVKTESSNKVKQDEKAPTSSSWKIASYISFVVIVALIVLNIISRSNGAAETTMLDKSIAVLPLKYLSEDPNKQYIADGVLDAITGHLSMLEGLRVMPRTSVEQYRENKKSAKEIGEELDVGYLIEGSFLMVGDQVKLTIQLVVAAEGDHIFFKEYNRDYRDIFAVQSEVAQTIANEIQVAITPEVKLRIEKIPTTSLTAYDFYLRGMNEYYKYSGHIENREVLKRAEALFHSALESDSTFALAYIGLAWVHRRTPQWDLDSLLVLAETALSLDDQLSEGYGMRGTYYFSKGLETRAVEEFDKAIKLNPNNSEAYLSKGELLRNYDRLKSIENFHKAISTEYGLRLPSMLRDLSEAYSAAGFIEKAKYYRKEALKLDDDSTKYYIGLFHFEKDVGNYGKAIEFGRKSEVLFAQKSSINNYGHNLNISNLAHCYLFLGQYEESLKYYKKFIENKKALGRRFYFDYLWIGLAYWQNGYIEEAEYYFKESFSGCNRYIESGRVDKGLMLYYFLAEVYAFREEKDKVYENLRNFTQRQTMPSWLVTQIKNDPFFDSIRDEPEFQQLVRDVEAKYRAEHERVRKWQEDNDML